MHRTWTIVHNLYDTVHAALWAILCAFVLYFVFVIFPQLPAARARVEAARISEIVAEDRLYCEKWGMPVGTQHYTLCALDLQKIRENADRRAVDDIADF